MKKLLAVLAVTLLTTPFTVSAQWWGYSGYRAGIWGYPEDNYSWYYGKPYDRPYYRPYIVVPPVAQSGAPVVPQYTVPPVPTAPAPLGYQWTTLIDAGCNCVKWVLVPSNN
jgi:hypothetical protein